MRMYITRTPYPGNIECLGTRDESGAVTVESLLEPACTLQHYQKQHPDKAARALTWSELYPEIKAHEQARTTDPQEITEAEWWDMFECLPPGRYQHVKGFEVFHCIEMLSGNLCAWYAAKGDKFYTWTDFVQITSAEIAAKLERIK